VTFRPRLRVVAVAVLIALGIASVSTAGTASAQPSSSSSTISAAAVEAEQAFGTSTFAAEFDELAVAVAAALGIDGSRMVTAWQAADSAHQRALVAALTQVGVPYRRNSSKPGVGFDCSGLTTYAWGQAGTTLYRQSKTQINRAAKRTQSTAMAGDLVWYPGHVMMYLGVDTAIVHSPYSGRNVEVTFIAKKRAGKALYGNPIG
jgi:cell wall-associated NlpC family hydrolase